MPTTQGRPTGENQGSIFQRVTRRFTFRGIDVAHPPDKLAEGRFPSIKNFRAYVDGELRSRPGLQQLFLLPATDSIHSLLRLNDPSSASHAFLVGAGTNIYIGDTQAEITLGSVESGFSASPKTWAVARPDRSPENWAYIGDRLKLRKANAARVMRSWGIPEVPTPPSIAVTPPKVLNITDATSLTQDGNTWNNSVNAGVLSVGTRVNTTITYIVYDAGTTGYCGISPAALGTEIQPGMRIRINSGGGTDEYAVVEQVFALIADTTIESISYDSGGTGLCWIQLANATAGLVPNCLLRFAGIESARVLEVVIDKDNKAAIRCNLATTRTAGDTVQGLRAFRCYTTATHNPTETLTANYIQSTITFPGVAPAGVGNIRLNAARDLSKFSTRHVTDDDEVVVSIYLSDPSKLVEGRIWFDIDPNTTAVYAAADLSRNYLFYAFRPEDLQTFAGFDLTQTQVSATAQNIQKYQFDLFNTSLDQANRELAQRRETFRQLLQDPNRGGIFRGQRRQLLAMLNPGDAGGGGLSAAGATTPGPFQAGSGKEQWFTLRFKVGQLNRIGQDTSRTLKDVTSVMANFKMSANSQVVRLGSWYISGGGNPDMQASDDLKANAYYYIIQGRDDRTGARSLPSPPTRAGVVARRQNTTITSALHPNPQVNKLDIYRWGGTRFEFLYLGSVANSGTPTFTDNFTDDQLSNSPPLNFNTFPPFATTVLPYSGQVSTVGPKVTWVSGTQFNTSWSPGTLIEINSKTYILYGSPTSATELHLTESAGTQTNVAATINSPVVIGTPLPSVFGPYALAGGLFIFGVGDMLNPYSLYWTNGNDPDTTSDKNYVEVPSNGSELIGGTIYDGRPFLFSADGMFEVALDGSGSPGSSTFRANPIANSRGAISATAICADVFIYFVGKDGIYKSEGGQPRSITNDSLYTLFPHDGIIGTSTNGIIAPDYTRTSEFSLTTYGPLVYFDYPGVDNKFHTLIWDDNLQGWLYDDYALVGDGARVHYGERGQGNFRMLVGGTNGILCTANGLNDLGVPIQAEVWLPCFDAGDERSEKVLGDMILDLDTGGIPIQVETWLNNYATRAQGPDLVTAPSRTIALLDMNGGLEYEARNFAIKIFYSGSASLLKLFSWQPSFYTQPENITLRAPDWDYGSKIGAEWFQGVLITADTDGQDVSLRAEFDQNTTTRDIIINHPGLVEKYYPFPGTPVIAHHVRLRQVGTSVSFKNFNIFWVTESYPESSVVWNAQPQGSELPGWKHLREAWITYVSSSDATLNLTLDSTTYSFQIPSSGGVKRQFYLPLAGRKCRIWTPEIVCPTPLTLFEKDTVFNLGLWGRGEQYRPMRPFGGPNSDNLSPAYV